VPDTTNCFEYLELSLRLSPEIRNYQKAEAGGVAPEIEEQNQHLLKHSKVM
jgi:hypothetical protein